MIFLKRSLNQSFTESIETQLELVIGNMDNNGLTRDCTYDNETVVDYNEASRQDYFVLACRYFNRGLAKLASL